MSDLDAIKVEIQRLFDDGERREGMINCLQKDIKEIRDMLANRLPNWATFALSILTALLGASIGFIMK